MPSFDDFERITRERDDTRAELAMVVTDRDKARDAVLRREERIAQLVAELRAANRRADVNAVFVGAVRHALAQRDVACPPTSTEETRTDG